MHRTGQTDELACSFCRKRQGEVRKLVAGPAAFICNECVEVCRDIMANDERAEESSVTETPSPSIAGGAGITTRCALCRMPMISDDGLIVRDRGIVCFGCLGEVEAALQEYRGAEGEN